jgi:hypothetical protein
MFFRERIWLLQEPGNWLAPEMLLVQPLPQKRD